MPFKILSIDGGGLRGIIPLLILNKIEQITSKSIADIFDLIAGTSTGGLVASALALKRENKPNESKFTVQEVIDLYKNNAINIFPPRTGRFLQLKDYVYPKYDSSGLEKTFNAILGEKKLNDCRKPILITSYDFRSYQPLYFTSRFVNPTSNDYHIQKNFYLKDICRATSAAPTYFPPFSFNFLAFANEQPLRMDCIDGGIFLNNPSLAALVEVLSNSNDTLYKNVSEEANYPFNDVYVLSLGTGIVNQIKSESFKATKWGEAKWAKPLITAMMQANGQAVEYQMKILSKSNHVRINPNLEKHTEFDDSSESAFKYWTEETLSQVINNSIVWDEVKRILDA
ncbi:patatin-like phospholipase family protein [Spirosoma sp. RP8]|uniref:Patatin-like phospholipase family protein n=1 Tax=Spirosoma liriopis TaxID=2937440 RepID=A0ABT0HLZ0_9BACT|nr:patatin-like phospholipase family protein [Spirosoma liriopis]MCK8493152.1 patatin-like phospholipase family protein [Spirosoma liriopis]